MGMFTTTKDTKTLKEKARKATNSAYSGKGGAICAHCNKPIAGGKAGKVNYHGRCAKEAAKKFR